MDFSRDQSKQQSTLPAAQKSPRRSSLLLNWLKDPRNKFMFWEAGSRENVLERMENSTKDLLRENSPPLSDVEQFNDTITRDSSDSSDVWEVSSIDTPTTTRKSHVKEKNVRRKTTSFKTCKHSREKEIKLKRRHTYNSTSQDSTTGIEEENKSGSCFCGKDKSGTIPLFLELYYNRRNKRNSLHDSDSGITDSDTTKSRSITSQEHDLFHVQVPLDEIARKGNNLTLHRSKSESNITMQSPFSNVYADIETQNDVPETLSVKPTRERPILPRKPQSLKLPSKEKYDESNLMRTKSLFDLSGKDPLSEADFFFGVKTENDTIDDMKTLSPVSTAWASQNLSKSCDNLAGLVRNEQSVPVQRRVVVVTKDEQQQNSRHHPKVRSLPSLRVRALRKQYVTEEPISRNRLSRVRLRSIEQKDENNNNGESKKSLEELRKRLKSIDITDLVNNSDIYQVDHWGNTLLHYAAAQGDDKLIKTILGEGASVWTPNKFGHLPLDFVSSFRSARFLSHSTLFYGHGSNMVQQGHLHPKSIHYEL